MEVFWSAPKLRRLCPREIRLLLDSSSLNSPSVESNAIEQEQRDFAEAIRTGREPRVTGSDGLDAVAVAEMVLASVREHQWDGADSRRVGHLASPMLPLPMVAAMDEWATDDTVILRRKAG